jgi:hypothetical protein
VIYTLKIPVAVGVPLKMPAANDSHGVVIPVWPTLLAVYVTGVNPSGDVQTGTVYDKGWPT